MIAQKIFPFLKETQLLFLYVIYEKHESSYTLFTIKHEPAYTLKLRRYLMQREMKEIFLPTRMYLKLSLARGKNLGGAPSISVMRPL